MSFIDALNRMVGKVNAEPVRRPEPAFNEEDFRRNYRAQIEADYKRTQAAMVPDGTPTQRPQPREGQYKPDEKAKVGATVMGEAGLEGRDGLKAVFNTIQNRRREKQMGWDDVLDTYQYDAYRQKTPEYRRNYAAIKGDDSGIGTKEKELLEYVLGLMDNNAKDITGGATHFLNPEVTKQISSTGELPDWYDPKKVTYSSPNHQFLNNIQY